MHPTLRIRGDATNVMPDCPNAPGPLLRNQSARAVKVQADTTTTTCVRRTRAYAGGHTSQLGGVDDVVLARPRGCTRYGDDVETVYYCVQYTGAVIDVSRHVIVSQWNERKSDMG